jgi:hypothetical protein
MPDNDVGLGTAKATAKATDKELFAEGRKEWREKSQTSVTTMLDRFDVLTRVFVKRGVGGQGVIDEPWKKFCRDDIGIHFTTANRLMLIAGYAPFRNPKYQAMLPLKWTSLYPITAMKEPTIPDAELVGNKKQVYEYKRFDLAVKAKIINPDMTTNEAVEIASYSDPAEYKDAHFQETLDRLVIEAKEKAEEKAAPKQRTGGKDKTKPGGEVDKSKLGSVAHGQPPPAGGWPSRGGAAKATAAPAAEAPTAEAESKAPAEAPVATAVVTAATVDYREFVSDLNKDMRWFADDINTLITPTLNAQVVERQLEARAHEVIEAVRKELNELGVTLVRIALF